ncbi:MAG: arabinan endo-1,5-alpha-L-arabinosidase [Gemmatimonadetes bacterium]|nr:arabinan endo-1,5-alpha-L-arabinosidase [Gemmatimonadota bacterium]
MPPTSTDAPPSEFAPGVACLGSRPLRRGRAGIPAVACLAAVLLGGACGGDDPADVPEDDPCTAAQVSYPTIGSQDGTRYVRDPEAVREGGSYYVFSTNDGIPIRRSSDLIHWTTLGRVFPNQLPSWAAGTIPGVQAPWAPAVAWFNGRYHLYYSLSTFGSPRSAIGLSTSPTLNPDSPDYAWTDRGKVLESFANSNYNAIDPAVIEDAEGGLWLAWGSWWDGIKMRALDRQTGLLSTANSQLYSLARRPVEQAIEGAYLIRRGQFYYLFASFDLCCQGVQSTYNVRVGRSTSVTGPYLDRDGVSLLSGGGTMVLAGYGRVRGPGHGSVLALGNEYLLVHHYYDNLDQGNAHLQVRPLVWDDAGWPVAGEPYDGTPPGPPPPGASLTGRWGYWAADEYPRAVELQAGGAARACDRTGIWSYVSPTLTIEWPAAAGTGARTDRSTLSASAGWLAGRTSDGRIIRGYRLP